MKLIHGSSLEDPELLQQIVLQELKVRGIEVRLETPKPSKKSFVPFSTPATNTPHGSSVSNTAGRIFGRRLGELSKLLVSLDENQDVDVLVPKLIVSACKYVEDNVEIEGIYRLSGSAARQKAMRKEMDCHDTDFREMTPSPSVLDVAALLKQFLRELPLPIVPRIFHLVLASSFSSPPGARLDNLLLCLLLLPADHLASLSFLLRHLATVARSSGLNKMTATNLATIFSPNLLPVTDSVQIASANTGKVDKKVVESNNQRLKLHTEILEVMILNSESVGQVTTVIMDRYNSCMSIQMSGVTSHSEDNLDDDNVAGPSRRKTKKKHIRRRSGSLSRVLSSIGKSMKKAMGHEAVTPGTKVDPLSIHSTPLPAIGATPDFPSPRHHTHSKRKAVAEHEMSPTNKAQKRTFESTFTPKMRTRTFSVKRFKRKKSEGKFKQVETFVSYNEGKVSVKGKKNDSAKSRPSSSPEARKIHTRSCTASSVTPDTTITEDGMDLSKATEDLTDTKDNEDFEEQYAEVKAQFLELEQEIGELERTAAEDEVTERFEAACAAGNLARESRETARQMARVRRSSSGQDRKPRSPSQRRIGVIRRRSREREQKMTRSPERSEAAKAPSVKPCLTPMNLDKPSFRNKLQRGQPNSTSVGLEKPVSSPVIDTTAGGKARIKMSFKHADRPAVKVNDQGPVKAKQLSPRKCPSPCEKKIMSTEKKKLSHGDSIASLKNDLSDMIEKSFGSDKNGKEDNLIDEVFNNTLEGRCEGTEVNDLSAKIENISFKNNSPSPLQKVEEFFVQSSPVTRSQLRRVSDCFEFARPEEPREREDTLRRQSSAFEFRSKFAAAAGGAAASDVATYENLARDVATRGSLRRRNSSVRDLVQKIESETRKRSIDVPTTSAPATSKNAIPRAPSRGAVVASNPSVSSGRTGNAPAGSARPVPEVTVDNSRSARKQPLRITDSKEEDFADGWIDASEFFKNVTQAEAPQCGRSSIVKIRTQIQGRVKDSVTKFGGQQPGATPMRAGGPAARRLSARMGTSVATPGHARPPKTPSALASLPPTPGPGTRRQTLTGIKTTAAPSKRITSANYANPTIASINKARDKSPNYHEPQPGAVNKRGARSKSPKPSAATKSPKEPSYQNVKVERKNSNSRDIMRHPVERSSSSGSRGRKNRVRRNRSDAESRTKRKEERRYLTIGYPGEVRSPLKERQNIPANVRRSESDRTPSRGQKGGQEQVMTRAKLQEVENIADYENVAASVVRKHSLKSDVLMSPKPRQNLPHTPASARHVKRAASERSTPRPSHYYNRSVRTTPKMSLSEHRALNMELLKAVTTTETPRRSPRFSMI